MPSRSTHSKLFQLCSTRAGCTQVYFTLVTRGTICSPPLCNKQLFAISPMLQTTLDRLLGLTACWFLKARFNTLGKYKSQQETTEWEIMHVAWLFEDCNLLQGLVTTKLWSVNGPGGICWTIVCCAKTELTHRTAEMRGTRRISWWSFWLMVNGSESLVKGLMSHLTTLASTRTPAILGRLF